MIRVNEGGVGVCLCLNRTLHFPLGACVVRDASGKMSDYFTGNITDGCVGLGCNQGWNFTDCIQSQSCQFGLANSMKVQVISIYEASLLGITKCANGSDL